MTHEKKSVDPIRRTTLKAAAALTTGAFGALATQGVWAAGSRSASSR
jgi:hypothetical protein